MLIVELQNLILYDNTGLVAIENALLHTGQMLLSKKGSKEGKMIASLQRSEGVRLGNLLMTDRGQLLKNSDRIFTLAHLIPAIVVPACVTAMVGLLLI